MDASNDPFSPGLSSLSQTAATLPGRPELREYPFSFHGNGAEYFRIWIVNVMLTAVTLGIYLPWARVRTRKYFYGNTLLNDRTFDYLAKPTALLKGYLIVTVAMITVGLSVFAHGMTAWHGSESYADWVSRTPKAAVHPQTGEAAPDLNVPERFQSPGMPS